MIAFRSEFRILDKQDRPLDCGWILSEDEAREKGPYLPDQPGRLTESDSVTDYNGQDVTVSRETELERRVAALEDRLQRLIDTMPALWGQV